MRSGETKLFIGILVVAMVLVGFATVPTLFSKNRTTPPPPHETPLTVATLVPAGSHIVGNPQAPFTLVEFSDYQ